jgi:predicted nucleic acid-binding protein
MSLAIIDADAFVRIERGLFDFDAWIENHPQAHPVFTSTIWQQLSFGIHAWEPSRSRKRESALKDLGLPVLGFTRRHADRAAIIQSQLRNSPIGFADTQIAAVAVEEGAELLTFNISEFSRVPGLRFAKP